MRKIVWDTMSFATNWEGSPLQAEKTAADNEWRNSVNNTETIKTPESKEVPAGLPSINPESAHHVPPSDAPSAEADMDGFEDD